MVLRTRPHKIFMRSPSRKDSNEWSLSFLTIDVMLKQQLQHYFAAEKVSSKVAYFDPNCCSFHCRRQALSALGPQQLAKLLACPKVRCRAILTKRDSAWVLILHRQLPKLGRSLPCPAR